MDIVPNAADGKPTQRFVPSILFPPNPSPISGSTTNLYFPAPFSNHEIELQLITPDSVPSPPPSPTGMVYKNEVFTTIEPGDFVTGYIKKVREDEKLDISLQPVGYQQAVGDGAIADRIMDELQKAGGFLPYGDKTDADVIVRAFGCSKKNFKKSIGSLYKARRIEIVADGIKLVK